MHSALDPTLRDSEIIKHTKLLDGLRKSPAPWTPIGEFKPLRKPGRDASTTLDILSKRSFPRWIKEVMVDYAPRTPGAIRTGMKDLVNVVILPERVPDKVWVKSWVPTFLTAFEPGVLLVREVDADMQHAREGRAIKDHDGRWPVVTAPLYELWKVSVIPELFWASRLTCRDCLGSTPEELVARLQARGVTASILQDGLLVEGTDRYLTTDEAYVVQGRLTEIFREIVPPALRSASGPP